MLLPLVAAGILLVAAGIPLLTDGILPVVAPSTDADGIEDDRVIRYDFAEDAVLSDRAFDVSRNGNHGRIVVEDANAYDALPEADGTMTFADGAHHLRVPLDRPLADDFTVSVDVRAGRHGYFAGIVTSEEWWVVARDDRYGFYTPETGIAADHGTADGTWRQVTAVYRDETLQLYLDGEFVDERRVDEVGATETLYVGRRPNGYPLDGELDTVEVYDRAATAGEVRSLHAGSTRLPGFAFTDAFRAASAVVLVLLAVGAAGYRVRRTGEEANR